ncbi:MAG: TniQ family protein [Xenococcaceae cyanobacterium MO_234.B1]|nr:TniQ family protein [Xenococcaceae cyanobacterium MO_234.B1]
MASDQAKPATAWSAEGRRCAIAEGDYQIISIDLIHEVAEEGLYLVKPMLDAIRSGDTEWMNKYKDIAPLSTVQYQNKYASKLQSEDLKETRRLARKQQKQQSPILSTVILKLIQELNVDALLLRSKSSISISQTAKISDKERNEVLKFCPKCCAEDTRKYGEAYWHRQHQIPGMLVCLKHKISLLDSEILLENKQIHYYAASQIDLSETEKHLYNEEFRQLALSINQELDWLSRNYIEFRGMTWLRNQYKSLLIHKGFITKYSRTRFKYHEEQFTEAFVEFYSKELLETIQPQIWEKRNSYLEYSLFSCDITQTIDRITHVLLIKFLCGSIRNIFE